MADPFVALASTLSPAMALRVASSLDIDGRLSRALEKVPPSSAAAAPLEAAYKVVGGAALAAVLRGFAVAAQTSARDIRAVWSGPTFDGDGDHTTSAIAHLIDGAKEDVFASTYSATPDSEFVKALWKAVARGVRTTLLVDSTVNNGQTASMLRTKLTGARFWTYRAPDGQYALQHSKVLIVDSRSAFVTSANLSTAGAERNLEAGVVVHDVAFASGMRQRFAKLWEHGAITDLG
ncbi:DISARM system phospholipase D-like protein DrmC [Microbacterium sp. zg.Y1090]|uniref:DISARM system phospholipase D-like protein DrmC n=1 Tax=Microbacterium wangruii TaxID=3049073 RepID=UPI00214B5EC0|nr:MULTISPECIES: DISARM system phospholipase D-like protein DrmC [unclassified Microbacterium]MCR2817314.1 DISARM system phospholipase D-like protein DrmC [Microbacterium sp. zg.Y1090]WIM29198.1 DISARM system phospholipase D-like protein DrmC [Microbacterium sp. zg-Y1090]